MTLITLIARSSLAGAALTAVLGPVVVPLADAATASAPAVTRTAPAPATSTMKVKPGVTLNVRSGAGTSYAAVGHVTGGTVLTGQTQSNGWFRITSGAFAGRYVSGTYLIAATPTPLTTTPPAPSTTPTSGSFTGYVSKTLIETLVHSAPSTSSSYGTTLAPGTAVNGTLSGDWLRLSGGGYVSRALITTQPLSNGAVPASRLCNVPVAWNSPGSWAPGYTPKTVRQLDCFALKSLTGLENAYKAQFGRYARIDLAYRPLSEQYYWYDKFGYPRAAMPGTSNHGLGVAVDFRETDVAGEEFGWGGPGYKWLKANGWKWGFRNTFTYGQWGESYHWDFEGVN